MVPLALLEPLAHKVSKVTLERLESLAQLDLWDLVAPLGLLENQEVMVMLASLERLVSVELLDLRELVDSLALLAFPESKDTEGTLVWMAQKERAALQEQRVRVDLLVRMEPLDPWDPVVCLVREDVPGRLVLLVPAVMMVCPVLLVPLGPLVLLEHLVSQDLQERREKLALLEPVDLRAHRDPAERLVPLDLLDPLEPLATLVLMVYLEPKDLLVVLVLLGHLASQAPVGHPDLKEQQDLLGPREPRETLVSLALKERLDQRESLALLVH